MWTLDGEIKRVLFPFSRGAFFQHIIQIDTLRVFAVLALDLSIKVYLMIFQLLYIYQFIILNFYYTTSFFFPS